MNEGFAVGYESEELQVLALALARQLQLPIDNQTTQQLLFTADRLVLKIDNFSPLYADFSVQTWQKRRDAGKQQGLVRACKPKRGLKILDTTAGWGRDAAVLASFGAEVRMLERHPIMAALLADALWRRDDRSKEVLALSLENINALDYLQQLKKSDFPDVIYIDPMHPIRQKAALVKKDLQVLQQMVGHDEDALDLLKMAITCATQRVVVKWPQQLPPLLTPDRNIEGKTVRFDVYLPQT